MVMMMIEQTPLAHLQGCNIGWMTPFSCLSSLGWVWGKAVCSDIGYSALFL